MNLYSKSSIVFATSILCGITLTVANSTSDPIAKDCINQQLRNHKNINNKNLEENIYSNYCNCIARVVRNLANDQQLSDMSALGTKPKPEWLKGIERSAQKQCMVDPQAKLQSAWYKFNVN